MHKFFLATAALVLLLSAEVALAEEEQISANPWRGSSVSYGHSFTLTSLSRSVDLTWDPVYLHELAINPVWHFNDQLSTTLRFTMAQELTDADDTSQRYQWILADINLDTNVAGYVEPRSGIRMGGGLRITLPTSLASQAATLRLGVGPGINLSRKFEVLQGLTVKFNGRWVLNWHGYTRPETDSPWILCSQDNAEGCDFTSMGRRNAWNVLSGGLSAGLGITPRLSANMQFSLMRGGLYELSPDPTGRVEEDPNGSNARYFAFFSADCSYQLLDYLSLSLGLATYYPQLADDGTQRFPFINRFSTVSASVSVDIDPLITRYLVAHL